jgi:hypothetical protein
LFSIGGGGGGGGGEKEEMGSLRGNKKKAGKNGLMDGWIVAKCRND